MKLSNYTQGKTASNTSPYIEPYNRGVYEIQKLYSLDGTTKGAMFIAEFEVVEGEKICDVDPVTKKPVQLNAVGSCPAWRVKLTGTKNDPGIGNVLAFFEALMNRDDAWAASADGQAFMNAAAPSEKGDPQPCEFLRIGFETFTKLTREKKEPFTHIRWKHVPLTAEQKKMISDVRAHRAQEMKIAVAK